MFKTGIWKQCNCGLKTRQKLFKMAQKWTVTDTLKLRENLHGEIIIGSIVSEKRKGKQVSKKGGVPPS